MRLLVGRRDELAGLRVQIVNRLQRLLTELIPGGAGKKDLSAAQARRMLAGVGPRDPAGATRRHPPPPGRVEHKDLGATGHPARDR